MKEKLQEAVRAAMKAKDRVRLDTVRMLLSAVQYEEMQKKADSLSEEQSAAVLQREVNKRKEEIEYAEKAGRADQKERLIQEIACIEEFLPKQLSPAELEKIITDLKSANPSVNMGGVMKALKESYAGQYDGKIASEAAKKVLG